ncbi:MAG: V-type ATP synthase subunit I [Candidatus Woesearchaeota archaeon]
MTTTQTIYHVTFLLPRGEERNVLHALHQKGLCQIDFCKGQQGEQTRHLDRLHARIKELSQQLIPYYPALSSKTTSQTDEQTLQEVESFVETNSKQVTRKLAQLKELTTNMNEQETIIEKLRKLPQTPPSMIYDGRYTKWITGVLPKEELEGLGFSETEDRLVITEPITKELYFVCEIIREGTESLLKHEPGFAPLNLPNTELKPRQEIKKRSKQLKRLKEEHNNTQKELRSLAKKLQPEIRNYGKLLEDHIKRERAKDELDSATYHVTGEAWVPESDLEMFNNVLDQTASSHLIQSTEREDAPTLLKNNRYAQPFEEITRLYSVPRYKRFDPTMIIAIFFPLIFGIMYSDAIYGILIAGVGLAMTWMPNATGNDGYRNFSRILLTCGLFTMLMGMLAGSYFGNFAEHVGINIPKALDMMTDIIPLVIISLSIGLIHLGSGLIAGFKERLKLGKIEEAIKEQGVWIVFIIGALVALFFAERILSVALALMGVSLLTKAYYAYKEQGIINAILSVFDVSKLTGDLASYVRIMALAIGTSGIALAVNVMAKIAVEHIPTVGIAFAVIIFIIGHLFNIFISGLGAFIHTLRLHFLEHFGRYYEGDGEEYKPFEAQLQGATLK